MNHCHQREPCGNAVESQYLRWFVCTAGRELGAIFVCTHHDHARENLLVRAALLRGGEKRKYSTIERVVFKIRHSSATKNSAQKFSV